MSRETICGNYSQVILPFCVGIVNPPGLDIYGKNELLYLPPRHYVALKLHKLPYFQGGAVIGESFALQKLLVLLFGRVCV